VPGPSAVIAALSIAGLATDRFVFEGFLPATDSKVKQQLERVRLEERTLVFYEAPHRIKNTLKIASECFGGHRQAVIARELTKRFESVVRGTLLELQNKAATDANLSRGEIVLLIAGHVAEAESSAAAEWEGALTLFLTELPVRVAVDWVCKLYNVKRNPVYERALALKPNPGASSVINES